MDEHKDFRSILPGSTDSGFKACSGPPVLHVKVVMERGTAGLWAPDRCSRLYPQDTFAELRWGRALQGEGKWDWPSNYPSSPRLPTPSTIRWIQGVWTLPVQVQGVWASLTQSSFLCSPWKSLRELRKAEGNRQSQVLGSRAPRHQGDSGQTGRVVPA